MTLIKTHKALADLVAGKSVLHTNSLGKDSVTALEWLTTYAYPARIVSVFCEFLADHPDDERYFNYLKRRYPQVEFVKVPNTIELNIISEGIYQTPVQVNTEYNNYDEGDFDRGKQIEELKARYGCDYICDGSSKYESFARRTKFHQKGLEFKGVIYPLGMMSRAQVVQVIRDSGLKLHPSYRLAKGTYDHPSYWKMRAAMIAKPAFRKKLLAIYPLLILDQYRYEVLLKGQLK